MIGIIEGIIVPKKRYLDKKEYKIALVGNPNVGKSQIFNMLTGANQKIANFPGITVAHKDGHFKRNKIRYHIVDLPGIYGFHSKSTEEEVAQNYIVNENIDLIINVVDATKLERNLFLTLQLLEMGKKVLLVLNFYDKVQKDGTSIDIETLSKTLGIPIIPFVAVDKNNFEVLKNEIDEAIKRDYNTLHLTKLNKTLDKIANKIDMKQISEFREDFSNYSPHWLIVMSQISGALPGEISSYINKILRKENYNISSDFQLQVINEQYEIIGKLLEDVVHKKKKNSGIQKMDNILLHPWLGFIVFFFVMWIMFSVTFFISAPISTILELGVSALSNFTRSLIKNELIASFLSDGIINGVGFVLVFIPQIAFLFIFLAFLEHSGYIARVVFITDRFMNRVGISGRSIAPMLLGFGCNVPAILSTKAIKDQNERKVIILTNPFFSCSARFPVYVMIASSVYGSSAGFVVTLVYFTGIVLAIGLMYILRKTIFRGDTSDLILELVDLNIPTARSVFTQTYTQLKGFLINAASWISLGLMFLWLLSIFGPSGYLGPQAINDPILIKQTWIYQIGGYILPIFKPFGWDQRIIVALIFGFIAKEIVIGSLGLFYGVGGDIGALSSIIAITFTPVSAFAFMLFVLTYTPCIGTFFAIKHELGIKWALISTAFGLIIAYSIALMTMVIGAIIF